MAKDTELDSLKDAQDRAFQAKQDAWESQNKAWDRRTEAKESMNRAYQDKQSAYERQDDSWNSYQQVRSSNGPRIDQLNSIQETAFENMKRAFEQASDAHDSRDGASARSYADDGHAYKAESQSAVAERRQLVEEIRDARSRHEDTKPDFQRSKADFDACREQYASAKSKHERKQAKFQDAKADFENTKAAFQNRLEDLKSETKIRKSDRRSLAEQAGVPSEYLDNVYVSIDANGTVNIYFGGIGEPAGEGHGHYAMDSSGNVTYRRDPFDPHGSHNFTNDSRNYENIVDAEAARAGEFAFWCIFRGQDAFVESNTNSSGQLKIDIYYGPNGPTGPGHSHAVAYRDTPLEFVFDR